MIILKVGQLKSCVLNYDNKECCCSNKAGISYFDNDRNANEELKDSVSSDEEEEKLAVDMVKEEEEELQSEYREGRQLLFSCITLVSNIHVYTHVSVYLDISQVPCVLAISICKILYINAYKENYTCVFGVMNLLAYFDMQFYVGYN